MLLSSLARLLLLLLALRVVLQLLLDALPPPALVCLQDVARLDSLAAEPQQVPKAPQLTRLVSLALFVSQ